MPHVVCLLRDWRLVCTHVGADVIIAAAYAVIGITLFRFRHRLTDVLGRRIFATFGIFIPACGLTHVFDAVIVWYPYYWWQAAVKIVTAIVSIDAAVLVWRLRSRLDE